MRKLLLLTVLALATCGQVQAQEERWPAGDGCNTCSESLGGLISCTTLHCASVVTPGSLPPVMPDEGKTLVVFESDALMGRCYEWSAKRENDYIVVSCGALKAVAAVGAESITLGTSYSTGAALVLPQQAGAPIVLTEVAYEPLAPKEPKGSEGRSLPLGRAAWAAAALAFLVFCAWRIVRGVRRVALLLPLALTLTAAQEVQAQETYTSPTLPARQVSRIERLRSTINDATCHRLGQQPACTQADACTAAQAVGGAACTTQQALAANARIYPATQGGREELYNAAATSALKSLERSMIIEPDARALCSNFAALPDGAAQDAWCSANGLTAGCNPCP